MNTAHMLPTFVGIGVPRGGTTWLHALLDAHPRIYMPQSRKEIAYFHRFHDRGLPWYASFFPRVTDETRYDALGEITPGYVYDAVAARRMATVPSIRRLLIILRHPVDRLYSQYIWRMRHDDYRETFTQFLIDYPDAASKSMYAQHLANYLQVFTREQILILITEESVKAPRATAESLCTFLGADPKAMPLEAGASRVNASSVPRFRRTFALASRARGLLVRSDMDRLVRWAKSWGLKRLLVGQRSDWTVPPLPASMRPRLLDDYAADRDRLETILGRPIAAWRIADEQLASGEPVCSQPETSSLLQQ